MASILVREPEVSRDNVPSFQTLPNCQRRKQTPPKQPSETPDRALLRRDGITPFTPQSVRNYKREVIQKHRKENPLGCVSRAIVKQVGGDPRKEERVGTVLLLLFCIFALFALVGAAVTGYFHSWDVTGHWVWNSFMMLTLTVVLIFYFMKLEHKEVASWTRMDVGAYGHGRIPARVERTLEEVRFFVNRSDKKRNFSLFVEQLESRTMPDPFLILSYTDPDTRKTTESHFEVWDEIQFDPKT